MKRQLGGTRHAFNRREEIGMSRQFSLTVDYDAKMNHWHVRYVARADDEGRTVAYEHYVDGGHDGEPAWAQTFDETSDWLAGVWWWRWNHLPL